jgi:hypothetical protein
VAQNGGSALPVRKLGLAKGPDSLKEGTSQVKRTSWSQGLSVTADGEGVVPLAGAVAVRLLAGRVGLTGGLSTALARRGFTPGYDRGQVWVDVAVMLALVVRRSPISTRCGTRRSCSARSPRHRQCGEPWTRPRPPR